MRLIHLPTLACASLLFTSGCAFTDSGSGTETMRANIAVSYKFGGSDQSLCVANLNTPDGLPVEGATVTLEDVDGNVLVTLVADTNEESTYLGGFDGYHEKLYLKITSPQDGELEAALAGPTRHVIASPLNSSTFSKSSILNGLRVEWNAEHGVRADEVVIRVPEQTEGFGEDDDELENYVWQSGSMDDTGSGTIPGDKLTGNEAIQVLRKNTVSLSGGFTGSIFSSSYLVENQIAVE